MDNAVQHDLFKKYSPPQLNQEGLIRLSKVYNEGLRRIDQIYRQEVIKIEPVNKKGKGKLEVIKTKVTNLPKNIRKKK